MNPIRNTAIKQITGLASVRALAGLALIYVCYKGGVILGKILAIAFLAYCVYLLVKPLFSA